MGNALRAEKKCYLLKSFHNKYRLIHRSKKYVRNQVWHQISMKCFIVGNRVSALKMFKCYYQGTV